MKTLLWHLGLGDAIISAPIAVKLAKEHGEISVPYWEHNEESVRSFFVNHPEIHLFPTEETQVRPIEGDITIGYYKDEVMQEPFNTWFYNQLGLDYEQTIKEYCPLQKAAESIPQIAVPDESFALVHDDVVRGFNIYPELLRNDPPIIRVAPNGYNVSNYDSILRYANLIKHAAEIHCIDSSFIHLADRLESTGRLFYHKYARPNAQVIHFLKDWTIL